MEQKMPGLGPLWHCHPLCHDMPSGAVAGGIAVVIDVLRATTTIITSLVHGASGIVTVPTVEAARSLSDGQARPLLGGERGGLRIDGFDLGNSPAEYASGVVAGREIVFTTTNGTAAIGACGLAAEVLLGALVNRRAVAGAASRLARDLGGAQVHLVCAGTDGQFTEEDLLAAGAILDAGPATEGSTDRLTPSASAAVERFREIVREAKHTGRALPAVLADHLGRSRGGRNLITIGMGDDLPHAAAIDTLPLVPRLDRTSGRFVGIAAEPAARP
jgi:2-phosphosulfolactate phosphatase